MRSSTQLPRPNGWSASTSAILAAVQRGEVYEYIPVIARPGQSRMRLIISAAGINEADQPVVLGLQVLDHDPGGLLSIPLAHLGWASVLTIEAVLRSRLGNLIYTATDDEMEPVSAALRAAQDL
jgi:mRNA-degrading endonuclease toxin of MazEF toxin-antitoxin module